MSKITILLIIILIIILAAYYFIIYQERTLGSAELVIILNKFDGVPIADIISLNPKLLITHPIEMCRLIKSDGFIKCDNNNITKSLLSYKDKWNTSIATGLIQIPGTIKIATNTIFCDIPCNALFIPSAQMHDLIIKVFKNKTIDVNLKKYVYWSYPTVINTYEKIGIISNELTNKLSTTLDITDATPIHLYVNNLQDNVHSELLNLFAQNNGDCVGLFDHNITKNNIDSVDLSSPKFAALHVFKHYVYNKSKTFQYTPAVNQLMLRDIPLNYDSNQESNNNNILCVTNDLVGLCMNNYSYHITENMDKYIKDRVSSYININNVNNLLEISSVKTPDECLKYIFNNADVFYSLFIKIDISEDVDNNHLNNLLEFCIVPIVNIGLTAKISDQLCAKIHNALKQYKNIFLYDANAKIFNVSRNLNIHTDCKFILKNDNKLIPEQKYSDLIKHLAESNIVAANTIIVEYKIFFKSLLDEADSVNKGTYPDYIFIDTALLNFLNKNRAQFNDITSTIDDTLTLVSISAQQVRYVTNVYNPDYTNDNPINYSLSLKYDTNYFNKIKTYIMYLNNLKICLMNNDERINDIMDNILNIKIHSGARAYTDKLTDTVNIMIDYLDKNMNNPSDTAIALYTHYKANYDGYSKFDTYANLGRERLQEIYYTYAKRYNENLLKNIDNVNDINVFIFIYKSIDKHPYLNHGLLYDYKLMRTLAVKLLISSIEYPLKQHKDKNLKLINEIEQIMLHEIATLVDADLAIIEIKKIVSEEFSVNHYVSIDAGGKIYLKTKDEMKLDNLYMTSSTNNFILTLNKLSIDKNYKYIDQLTEYYGYLYIKDNIESSVFSYANVDNNSFKMNSTNLAINAHVNSKLGGLIKTSVFVIIINILNKFRVFRNDLGALKVIPESKFKTDIFTKLFNNIANVTANAICDNKTIASMIADVEYINYATELNNLDSSYENNYFTNIISLLKTKNVCSDEIIKYINNLTAFNVNKYNDAIVTILLKFEILIADPNVKISVKLKIDNSSFVNNFDIINQILGIIIFNRLPNVELINNSDNQYLTMICDNIVQIHKLHNRVVENDVHDEMRTFISKIMIHVKNSISNRTKIKINIFKFMLYLQCNIYILFIDHKFTIGNGETNRFVCRMFNQLISIIDSENTFQFINVLDLPSDILSKTDFNNKLVLKCKTKLLEHYKKSTLRINKIDDNIVIDINTKIDYIIKFSQIGDNLILKRNICVS